MSFIYNLKEKLDQLIIGDPEDIETDIGPLATEDILIELDSQIQKSKKLGASIISGGFRLDKKGYFYSPTLVTDLSKKMPIYYEETFGPVAPIYKLSSEDEVVK